MSFVCRAARMTDQLVGTYECVVTNGNGEATAAHTLNIEGNRPPRPVITPAVRNETVYKGGEIVKIIVVFCNAYCRAFIDLVDDCCDINMALE